MSGQSGATRRRVANSNQNSTDFLVSDGGSLRQRTVSSQKTPEQSNDKGKNEGVAGNKSLDVPKLTLLEEVYLLGLRDTSGFLSFWNDSLSYVLRGCILIELALRKRIRVLKDHYTVMTDIIDRPIEVISSVPTGELLLDEALKVLKNSDKNRSVLSWMDLLSGETWNIYKAGFQLKQVRSRLAKGLVDKGVLRAEMTSFILFDKATHPVQDYRAKYEVILRLFDTLGLPRAAALSGKGNSENLNSQIFNSSTILVGPNGLTSKLRMSNLEAPRYYPNEDKQMFALLRRVCLVCAAVAANVLENPLYHLDMETRDYAFMRAEELLNIYGHWPYAKDQSIYADVSETDPSSMQVEEVVSAVLCVLRKMDKVI
ncbi:hypothetical protein BB559_001929 [Furculomyces boomerangus]|uniref:Vacuolar protein sorting-associated protein 74 n=1 Tax=Furculomyces boomerangus TaxID=61424 RepID=A0A2T9YZI6_9FUNG|nr:hypothetical protein BB559_001929 [Furculomyces boomerangus]